MDFLRLGSKPKVIRTRLYGDQEVSRFELELLHTPIVQRLYELKQLGFTDRVYPDAVHSRFNHVLGVAEVVQRMVKRLITWLKEHPDEEFAFDRDGTDATVSAKALAEQLELKLPALRLMGVSHDLTHAAFGHTLEDEVNVFDEKHDSPRRQALFFNALVAQLLYLWCSEARLLTFNASAFQDISDLRISADFKDEKRWAEDLAEYLEKGERRKLASNLRDLELAFRLLLHLDFVHEPEHQAAAQADLLVTHVAEIMDNSVPRHEFLLSRDVFLVDLVGNTICADLLDYARRDADNAGLHIQFDDRFLRYLCVVSVKGNLSPTGKSCIRTAIQIFTDKMRHDVLSEMSGVLKARYLLNERVLFHPTKCAAGAMLGTAVQLLDLRDLPGWMQVLGDRELVRVLVAIAANLETLGSKCGAQIGVPRAQTFREVIGSLWLVDQRMVTVLENAVGWMLPAAIDSKSLSSKDCELLMNRARSARNVLCKLTARRFPKLAYRLRNAHQTGGASDQTIAETYSLPKERYELERRVEDLCRLPMGSIFIHCPRRKTSLKVAEVLVVGSDLKVTSQLQDVTSISPEGLGPYQDEIRAIQEMYSSIWQFHAYVDVAYWDRQPVVQWVLERELKFLNDNLLTEELGHEPGGAFHLIAGPLRDEIPPALLSEVVERVDQEVSAKMRLGAGEELKDRLLRLIREVRAENSGTERSQPGLPGI